MKTAVFFIAVLTALLTVSSVCAVEQAGRTEAVSSGSDSGTAPYTPRKGSGERKAIMDALRSKVREYHNLEVIFVVKRLKVQGGWAWAETSPASPDGQMNYEEITALLQKKKGVWSVVELACMEEDTPGCIGDPKYFDKLRARFPSAPTDIFPVGRRR